MKQLNKTLDILINQFRSELSSLPLIQEYNTLAKQMKENEEITTLQSELKHLQVKMVMARQNKKMEEFENLKKEYDEKNSRYQNHPLFVNYLNLKNEVNELMQEISDILNNI